MISLSKDCKEKTCYSLKSHPRYKGCYIIVFAEKLVYEKAGYRIVTVDREMEL